MRKENIKQTDGRDDEREKTTHKNEVRKDNIKQTDGRDDLKGKTTHKTQVSNDDNIKQIDGEVGNRNNTENYDLHDTHAHDDNHPKESHKTKFYSPIRKPTKIEERRMVGKAVEILIISCMKNHVYKFNNKIRIQSEGGPIGLGLTGEIGDCFMIKWDKKFLQKCKSIGINITMYSRFKDDIFISASSLEKGTKLVDEQLVIDDDKKREDEDKWDDDITMEVVRQVAELVNPMLKFTVDVPSHHDNRKIAVLDLEIKVNKEKENRIDYEFFEKPNKNPKILLAESAINAASKRTILTQECLRRIRNTKIELGDEVRNIHLNRFMLKMKNSGYNENYRVQILNSSLNKFKLMVKEDKNGKKKTYIETDHGTGKTD